jgi:hypothetical protein
MLLVLPWAKPTAAITEDTPIITPSMVRKDRTLLLLMLFTAILYA